MPVTSVSGIERRIVQGTQAQIQALIQRTQGGGGINTAYIERLNATFRARLVNLVRRGRALARQRHTLYQAAYLMGTIYNFCTDHDSLRMAGPHRRSQVAAPHARYGRGHRRPSLERLRIALVPRARCPPGHHPDAAAAGPRALKALIARWCS